MATHYSEDISILCPQIPTSVDDATGLIRALENGTEEISHLLRNSCNLILECRCCKAVFRHAKNFHDHKLNVCRAYHASVTPTYQQVLDFQKAVATLYDQDRPSTSKRSVEDEEVNLQMEVEEDQTMIFDVYDGVEEFCRDVDSPEPGEIIDERRNVVVDAYEDDPVYASSSNSIEGEYFGDNTLDNRLITLPATKTADRVKLSGADAVDEKDTSNDDSDAISLPESDSHIGQLRSPIFNDQLLESPTDHDYFGKGEKIPAHLLLLPIAQVE